MNDATNSLIPSGEINLASLYHGSASGNPTVYISNPAYRRLEKSSRIGTGANAMSKYRQHLPQLDGGLFLTDGGLETT
jgi:hypothetical protein